MEKKYKLPREFAEKWCEALRSGKYTQAEKKLYIKKHQSFCCLGVACMVQGIPKTTLLRNHNQLLTGLAFVSSSKLPIGITRNHDLNRELANLNDRGKSFPEIASWLETNVEFI